MRVEAGDVMKVINTSKNTILGENISIANTFSKRFLGLMPKKSLEDGEGLVIAPCNSIHMFFMSFAIDVLFVDKDNKIIYMVKEIKPWGVSKVVWDSDYVIELPAGTLGKTNTEIGDLVNIK